MKFEINTDNMTYFDLWLLKNVVRLMDEQAQNPIDLNEETIDTDPQPQPQEAKRRKKKSDHLKVVETPEPEAPAPEPEATPVPPAAEPEPTGPVLTVDDMRAALHSFSRKQGVPASAELLKKFDASRISDLNPARYADFLKECGQ